MDAPLCGDGPRDDAPVLLRVCEPNRLNPDLREFSGSAGEDLVHELSQQLGAFCRVGAGFPPAQGPCEQHLPAEPTSQEGPRVGADGECRPAPVHARQCPENFVEARAGRDEDQGDQ